MKQETRELAILMAEHLNDKRAQHIVALDVSQLTIITDVMLICNGRSTIQVKALCDTLEEMLSEKGLSARRREGATEGRWIVLDFQDIIVHIFHEQERSYYNLERLWMDGTNKLQLPFSQEQEAARPEPTLVRFDQPLDDDE